MKKKIIMTMFLLIVVAGGAFFYFREQYSYTMTLDINPSFKIKCSRNKKIVKVEALNQEAKDLIRTNFKGKKLEDLFNKIAKQLIKKDSIDDQVVILIHATKDLSTDEIQSKLYNAFVNRSVLPDVIIIDNITKEDKQLAKKYNITPAKASYIKQLIKNSTNNYEFKDLIDKAVSELQEMNNTGLSCEEGYFLERGLCYKEVEVIEASEGKVCPRRTLEYNGVCYETIELVDGEEEACPTGAVREGSECVETDTHRAEAKCKEGTYREDIDSCEIDIYIGDAYEYCRDPGRTLYDHKCLATKPTINGGCLGSDMLYNGTCVNTIDDYYYSEWMCPNGQTNSTDTGSLIYPDNKCMEQQFTPVSSYECEKGYTLVGNECIRKNSSPIGREKVCPSDYTMIEGQKCINLNYSREHIDGFVCEGENTKVRENQCVIYDVVAPKK